MKIFLDESGFDELVLYPFSQSPLGSWSTGKGTIASTLKQPYFPNYSKFNSSQTILNSCVPRFLVGCGENTGAFSQASRLPQISKDLVRCSGWFFSGTVSRLRPHSQKTHLNHAESRGRTPTARQRRYVGRNGCKQRHLRTSATIVIRRRHHPRTRETFVESERVQS